MGNLIGELNERIAQEFKRLGRRPTKIEISVDEYLLLLEGMNALARKNAEIIESISQFRGCDLVVTLDGIYEDHS